MTSLHLVFCDREGQVYDHPELAMAGASGGRWLRVPMRETVPLPPGATIVSMPGRRPVGWDPSTGQPERVSRVAEVGAVWAAAAVLPPAYLRTLLPAQHRPKRARTLPLLGYAAVGWAEGGFRVAAMRLDRRRCWDPEHFDTPDLPALIEAKRAAMGPNRIVDQLAHCALDYHCYTAQNLFYGRWEAGVPVSPVCNADCVGCISLQPAGCCPSPQQRIDFEPTADETAAVLVEHLAKARQPIASFGQGCEGEPLLRADLIAEAVAMARRATPRGTVNVNTNGSRPDAVEELARAGVDSLRISLASTLAPRYDAYHRPRGYHICTVAATIEQAKAHGLWVALNVLACPGVTDTKDETAGLVAFARRHRVDAVELRNLNLDPDLAIAVLRPQAQGLGMRRLVARLRSELPGVAVASFNTPVEKGRTG